MGTHKSTDYKLSAVKYYLKNKDNGISLKDTCDIYECSKYSLVRWLNRYLEENTVKNKSRKEGSYKITKTHVNHILSLIKTKPTITLDDILGNFHKKFKDITLSKTHLSNIIRQNNITYKQVQIKHKPDVRYNKPIDYEEEYKKFYDKIKKYKMDNIIAIDETSVSIGIHISKGREYIGKRLDKTTTNNKVFVKYTLIMAITTKGVLDWILYEKGGSDHIRLIKFINQILKKNTCKLILMDNASCHRNELVKKFILETKNDYVYIFPYNHSMNPIERYFNQLKHYIKKDEPMSYDLIKTSIKNSINKISKESYINYFKSSLEKNKKDIELSKSRYIKKPKIYKT